MTVAKSGAGRRLVITRWSAISPFGLGQEAFREGIRAGRNTVHSLDAEQWSAPVQQACLVPDFSVRDLLGKKGTRGMDRATGLAVGVTAELLRDDDSGSRAVPKGEGTGLVLGTTTGSADSMMGYTRTSMQKSKPFLVDPALMPYTVMNCAAGQCAIWHELKGPNATVAGGQSAGLLALNYARRLLASGRAERILCGAAEEFSSARAWIEDRRNGGTTADMLLGEGSAMFLIEAADETAADRMPLAEIIDVRIRTHAHGDRRSTVAACVSDVLQRNGVHPDDVWAVASSGGQTPYEDQETDALHECFSGSDIEWISVADVLGDTGAAGAAFQIAATLSLAGLHPEAEGKVAVITSVDRDGIVACSLLRTGGGNR
ncbi:MULTISPECIES: beta-ketoacyl synthase N-terminal-like domain-containing protein [Streptomyces]|uniref:3-oxoacyl-ACP synthase n=1 Tax=Streptomyces hawaiiensis TaxID=67305 RepID=A0A5B9BIL9_9ACTN|nr:beta-ketoacyl synthase N-terminal-like domain-containing protein [Streptomyces hawaiiensis]QCD59161.1 3-oxoacyl-ACP synthase [Streptomyces hawaiiensis]QED88052.1 3-oxoacyl-ACP synthase beta [Streptomyces hawaiiensis]